jgi:hypothetical protein
MNNQTHRFNGSRLLLMFSTILFGFLTAASVSATTRNPVGDYDGDGKTDIAVFRRSNSYTYVAKSSGGYQFIPWGLSSDTQMPGDYDGDGKTDLAVFRRGETDRSGFNHWYILRSSDFTFMGITHGLIEGNNVSVNPAPPADYDGDGITDVASFTQPYIYDPSRGGLVATATYFDILQSSTNSIRRRVFPSTYNPFTPVVPADYDGDGKADFATFNNGLWTIEQSTNGAIRTVSFGYSDDLPLRADFDGDGKADIAVWRRSNGYWYWLSSRDGSFNSYQFGLSIDFDVPKPGDYDGDGRTDFAVYRRATGVWYIQQSRDGFRAVQFGLSDDLPL